MSIGFFRSLSGQQLNNSLPSIMTINNSNSNNIHNRRHNPPHISSNPNSLASYPISFRTTPSHCHRHNNNNNNNSSINNLHCLRCISSRRLHPSSNSSCTNSFLTSWCHRPVWQVLVQVR